jgi:3-oxoadipate enol-lactonase
MTLHVVSSGPVDAPAVLFSGSVATSLELWNEQATVLSRTHRVIRYDHPGHGFSDPPPEPYTIADMGHDVLTVLDMLEIPAASFCGLSMGGMVGMWVAAHAPDRIERLVICCTTPRVRAGLWDQRIARVLQSGTGALSKETVDRWFTPQFHVSHGDVVARIVDMIGGTSDKGYVACCRAMAGMDLWPDLSRIRAATLVIAGSEDRTMTPHDAESIAATIRESGTAATVEIVQDAAHLVNVEQPKHFNSLIMNHLP